MSTLKNAPLLVEIYRGFDNNKHAIIERAHHGIIALYDGRGKEIYAQGDVEFKTHLRSCAKPFQILPLMETGFFDDKAYQEKYSLRASDLVLMMSSHAGQPIHTSRVKEILMAAGLDESALLCGVHSPQDTPTFCELLRTDTKPSVLHNNCSGKHAGMIIACLINNYDRTSYDDPAHPLQQRIKKMIADVSDQPVDHIAHGIDGCSLPSYVLPMKNLALMYARLSYWSHHDVKDVAPFFKTSFAQIWQGITTYPEYLAGTKRFDTDLMRAAGTRIISKGGVDGVLAIAVAPCASFPYGLGLAIKIADGDVKQQVRALVAKEILSKWDLWPDEKSLLDHLVPTKNFRGLVVSGSITHV